MDTSPQGIEFIRRHEGVRLKAYRDSAGVWTIGVGHTAAAGAPKPRSGMVLTIECCQLDANLSMGREP